MQDKLKIVLDSSPLTDLQSEEFLQSLSKLEDYMLAPVLTLFLEEPSLIPEFYKNFVSKKEAYESNDKPAFELLVEEEVEVLKA